jgi:hypothetical protein
MNKKTSVFVLSVAVLSVLALMLPAAAEPKADHTNNKGGNSASHSNSASQSENSDKSSASSDHDGDADSDPATAQGDSHDAEPDASPSDNQHPSGKDRSAEHGKSGNQGKAESHPDDSKGPMRYEGELGPDKPGGPGGTDLEDQDGNNGCGNDDDFNDDNNGHCGRNETPEVDEPGVEEPPGETPGHKPEDVQPGIKSQPGMPIGSVHPQKKEAVLGLRLQKRAPINVQAANAEGGALPFTGSDVTPIALLGLLSMGLGLLLVRRGATNV